MRESVCGEHLEAKTKAGVNSEVIVSLIHSVAPPPKKKTCLKKAKVPLNTLFSPEDRMAEAKKKEEEKQEEERKKQEAKETKRLKKIQVQEEREKLRKAKTCVVQGCSHVCHGGRQWVICNTCH